ncbi:MAG: hypothetical protein Q8M79_10745, partial [Dehalococcoidia bacterium]|nr:hypothetical protein [Dehalococcoidia bacterium]
AMNIYRHELIERLGQRYPEVEREWDGQARKVARGQRDLLKQRALYVNITKDGDVESVPASSVRTLEEERRRAQLLLGLAHSAAGQHVLAHEELRLLQSGFRAIFADLATS